PGRADAYQGLTRIAQGKLRQISRVVALLHNGCTCSSLLGLAQVSVAVKGITLERYKQLPRLYVAGIGAYRQPASPAQRKPGPLAIVERHAPSLRLLPGLVSLPRNQYDIRCIGIPDG